MYELHTTAIILWVIFAVYTVLVALHTPNKDLSASSIIAKYVYWHGFGVMVLLTTVIVATVFAIVAKLIMAGLPSLYQF